MNTHEVNSSRQPKSLAPGLAAVRAIAWSEAFVLIPMHAFWMLFRSTPLVSENTDSAKVAAVGLLLVLVAGLASLMPRVRAALLGAEWLFHLTSALGMLLLLFYVALRDPLNPAVPITWPLCFWSVSIAFTLLADLALHERIRAQAGDGVRTPWIVGLLVAAAAWAAVLWLASGMAWAPYFWTASLVFHAVMAPWSRRNVPAPPAPARRWESVTALVESLFVVSLMLAAFLRGVFMYSLVGRAEEKYLEFVDIGMQAALLTGVALALTAARLRFAVLAHALVAGLFLWGGEAMSWIIPLVLGYGLTVLFAASNRQGALSYALTLPAVMAMWALGLLGFMLAGMVVVYHIGDTFARDMIGNMRVAAMLLYVAWLALAGWTFWRSKRTPAVAGLGPAAARGAPALSYAAAWIVVLVPVGYRVAMTMWPPVVFHRAERVEVGEPAGVCHAGYSRSDEEYADLATLGVHLTRIDFHWSTIQPSHEKWDFTPFDTYVDAAAKHNVRVLALLGFDNNAVETSERGSRREHYIAPEDLPRYLEYIRRTVARYKGRVYAWELWNEPDISRFWDGPQEELYELIRQSAQTVRETDPKAILLGPAMTGPLGVFSAPGIEGLHAIGALKPVDHPAMHLYVPDPRAYYGEFFRVKNAAAKYGHPGSVWITELGDPDGGVYPWRGSREHLAVHAIKAYTIATCVGIEKLVWYCYRDGDAKSQATNFQDSEGFFGLANADGSWKPVAYAYQVFSTHCSNSVIRTDLVQQSGGLAARQLRTALYRRANGESALVMWFEPGLCPGGHARVALELGQLAEPAVTHNITNGDTKPLFDKVIDVTETPTVITFQAPDPNSPVTLCATASPADAAWLLLASLLVVGAGYVAIRTKPEGSSSLL